jgi:hypothetical protein
VSIAGLVCTGFAGGCCHFLKRDVYVTPQRLVQDYRIVPEDYRKESQGIGFWNEERLHVLDESLDPPADPPEVYEAYRELSCQRWPKDEVETFDGFWVYGRITSLITIIVGLLAVVLLWFFACAQDMTVDCSMVWLHLAVGVFTILLLIASKSDLCNDSRLVFIEVGGRYDDRAFYEFPVAGCHAGTGQKIAIASFCCWYVAAIGIVLAYKDPNEVSILEKWAKITAASARTTKQTNMAPYPEEEKEDEASC